MYWGILTWGCGSADQWLINPSIAQANKVIKLFIVWHPGQTWLIWICQPLLPKIHGLWLFTWKQLLWQNTDQDSEVKTNQIVWIYIWIFFSYSRNVLILMVVEAFFSRISALKHSLVSLLFSEDEFECSSRQR